MCKTAIASLLKMTFGKIKAPVLVEFTVNKAFMAFALEPVIKYCSATVSPASYVSSYNFGTFHCIAEHVPTGHRFAHNGSPFDAVFSLILPHLRRRNLWRFVHINLTFTVIGHVELNVPGPSSVTFTTNTYDAVSS